MHRAAMSEFADSTNDSAVNPTLCKTLDLRGQMKGRIRPVSMYTIKHPGEWTKHPNSSLNSVMDVGERSVPRTDRFISRTGTPGTK